MPRFYNAYMHEGENILPYKNTALSTIYWESFAKEEFHESLNKSAFIKKHLQPVSYNPFKMQNDAPIVPPNIHIHTYKKMLLLSTYICSYNIGWENSSLEIFI